jgi:oligoendopeptidase F
MELSMVITREEVPLENRWNVEALYPNLEAWEKAFKSFIPSLQQKPLWPEFAAAQGTLKQGPQKLKEILETIMDIDRELSKLYTYAHLKHDENIDDPDFKKAYEQIMFVAHAFAQEISWFQPEIISLPEDTQAHYLASPVLADLHFHLEKIMRIKKHTLSHESEKLIALAGQALQTSYKAFNSMCDADFKFGTIVDSQGNEKPLSHATYGLYLREQDRHLREQAFKRYHQQYFKYENTLNELLTGQIQTHVFNAKSRNYADCLEAATFPKNIDGSVYHALIQAVNEQLPILHRYMDLRKRILKLDELHLYDIYVPLIDSVDIKMTYEEAEQIVIESVAPLGSEYQGILERGLKVERWVDRYENKNKRSGAYSSGCYDSMPYILMNYKGILRDVFTLAHEAGHSMHSYYSHKSQPYQYSDYPIFLAEVASTFNEDLLTRLLLERCQTKSEKIFLINQQIEDIRATLFRQTMFAEFELLVHQWIEQGIPLTHQLLKEEYKKLNAKYFGPSVIIDEEIAIEWARIPHFYYNFYVYQYATGISAALALSEKVLSGGKDDRDAYLNFLKGGSSKYPIDLLKSAGVDMTTSLPVKAAINKFDKRLTELENLLE